MCGIAAFFGTQPLPPERITATLARMHHRGPDAQRSFSTTTRAGEFITLLHARLSILDLDERSHQPFHRDGCTLIFNGEIYNYVEVRAELSALGYAFATQSDTEVLLAAYLEWGEACVERFEGMWAFIVWDSPKQRLFVSRDRFAEKPLYYCRRSEGIYFASETKILRTLMAYDPPVNRRHLQRYLEQGYKSLYKQPATFYEGIGEVGYAENVRLTSSSAFERRRYWQPTRRINQSLTIEEAIAGTRDALLESLRLRLRSDVPLAFCLSGGVDSASLLSLAVKECGVQARAYSILDHDPRYDERDNIRAVVQDTGVPWTPITLDYRDTLPRLRALVRDHDAPVATTTYYVHSLLTAAIARDGIRVTLSGNSADELFTGYYDHFLLHLATLHGTPHHAAALAAWQEQIAPMVRNPCFQDAALYVRDAHYREHLYDHQTELSAFLLEPIGESEPFFEETFCDELLRNRMLNELLHENTPLILHEDDLNNMRESLENRSPFLDSRLCDFAYSIPPEFLIRDGFGKYVLRAAMSGTLVDSVCWDRRKKGFNASIQSLFNLRDPEFRNFLLNAASPLADLVRLDRLTPLLDAETLPNHHSKFLFACINTQLFLEAAS